MQRLREIASRLESIRGQYDLSRIGSNRVSVIPCRLIGDLHEWLNECATVPARKPVKLTLLAHSPVRSRRKRRPRRALLQPVAVVRCLMRRVGGTRRSAASGSRGGTDETPPFGCRTTNSLYEDNGRWAVWVGRHALEKISRAPKGHLSRVRNAA